MVSISGGAANIMQAALSGARQKEQRKAQTFGNIQQFGNDLAATGKGIKDYRDEEQAKSTMQAFARSVGVPEEVIAAGDPRTLSQATMAKLAEKRQGDAFAQDKALQDRSFQHSEKMSGIGAQGYSKDMDPGYGRASALASWRDRTEQERETQRAEQLQGLIGPGIAPSGAPSVPGDVPFVGGMPMGSPVERTAPTPGLVAWRASMAKKPVSPDVLGSAMDVAKAGQSKPERQFAPPKFTDTPEGIRFLTDEDIRKGRALARPETPAAPKGDDQPIPDWLAEKAGVPKGTTYRALGADPSKRGDSASGEDRPVPDWFAQKFGLPVGATYRDARIVVPATELERLLALTKPKGDGADAEEPATPATPPSDPPPQMPANLAGAVDEQRKAELDEIQRTDPARYERILSQMKPQERAAVGR